MIFPQIAYAHGIVGKADLPIPAWLFSWAAAIVLVVSFVALSSLWRTPRLQRERLRRAFTLPMRLEPVLNLIGVALLALVVYSGFAGAQEANANFSVTFIYVVFWVGLPLLSVLFGDVFRLSYAAIWYVQVAALLLGHVGGLALAHDRALAIYRNVEEAVRSQYWMLAVMVAFTSFGLWLLSAVGT